MRFSDYLAQTPAVVSDLLDARLQDWVATTATYSPLVRDLCRIFAEANRDGKRLRATLVKLGFDIFAQNQSVQTDAIYTASLAYEVFQTSILIHDDIIDKSFLRRGKPTLHKILQKRCADSNDKTRHEFCGHYGVSQAICLGDMGLFLAIQMLADSDFDPALKNRALSFFTQSVIDTIAGQIIDVELPYMSDVTKVSPDDLLSICRYKTARYTITGPLSLGAILTGAERTILPAIAAYGDNLGIAFQLKDDLLGVFADETTIGKSVTSDIEEGKLTVLYFEALQRADTTQRAFLEQHYGTGPITPGIHAQIKEIFTTCGAKDATERLMQDFADKAIHAIDAVTTNHAYHGILSDLADFMIKRQK